MFCSKSNDNVDFIKYFESMLNNKNINKWIISGVLGVIIMHTITFITIYLLDNFYKILEIENKIEEIEFLIVFLVVFISLTAVIFILNYFVHACALDKQRYISWIIVLSYGVLSVSEYVLIQYIAKNYFNYPFNLFLTPNVLMHIIFTDDLSSDFRYEIFSSNIYLFHAIIPVAVVSLAYFRTRGREVMTKAVKIKITAFMAILTLSLALWVWIHEKEEKMQVAKIQEYCQDMKVDASLNGYNIQSGENPYLKTEVDYAKFDSIDVDVPGLYYKKNINDEIRQIMTQLCSENASDMSKQTEIFWYALNDKYSVVGVIERNVPTCIGGRCPADPVKFMIIKIDTLTIVHGFLFTASSPGPYDRKYKKVTDKDIKEIVNIILRDNTTDVLQ